MTTRRMTTRRSPRTDLARRRPPRTRRPALAVLLLGAALCCPSPGHAWREAGHFAVCEIAYRHLSDTARARVDEILDGRPFAPQCTWPDLVRRTEEYAHTSPWHYINRDGDDYFEPGTVNPEGDVLQALLAAERTLASDDATADDLRAALLFLGHFAGDSHQPLHVGHARDRGGNTIQVRWFGKTTHEAVSIRKAEGTGESCEGSGRYVDEVTGECLERGVERASVNLHTVWDLLMIQKFIADHDLRPEPGDSEFLHRAYATAITGLVPGDEIESLRTSTFRDWITDAFAGRERAYDVGRGRLGRRYYKRNIGYLNRQIVRAGYRLAFTLERLFGEPTPEAAAIAAEHEELRRRIAELLAGQPAL